MRRVLVVLGLAVLSASAAATVVLRLGLADLVAHSDVIVEGRVVQSATHRDRMGGIATTYTLATERAFKGASAGVPFEFTLLGGTLGDWTLLIPGMPSPELGEDVLLFLGPETQRGVRAPVGLSQGRFLVEREVVSGAKRLRRSLGGIDLVDPATGVKLREPDQDTFDYRALTDTVERLVREGR